MGQRNLHVGMVFAVIPIYRVLWSEFRLNLSDGLANVFNSIPCLRRVVTWACFGFQRSLLNSCLRLPELAWNCLNLPEHSGCG